jgi:hypothetical protein
MYQYTLLSAITLDNLGYLHAGIYWMLERWCWVGGTNSVLRLSLRSIRIVRNRVIIVVNNNEDKDAAS